MKKKLICIIGAFSLSTILVTACTEKDLTEDNKLVVEDNEPSNGADDIVDEPMEPEENTLEEELFDYDALGVEMYTYAPYFDAFELSNDQKRAISILAAGYSNWDSSMVNDNDWQDYFVSHFLQNSYFGFDYLSAITEDGPEITKNEVEYIQYSLTGEKINFDMADSDTINIYDSASILTNLVLDSYTYEGSSEYVIVHAAFINGNMSFDESEENVDEDQRLYLDITLKKNVYSCFDGYSIIAILEVN